MGCGLSVHGVPFYVANASLYHIEIRPTVDPNEEKKLLDRQKMALNALSAVATAAVVSPEAGLKKVANNEIVPEAATPEERVRTMVAVEEMMGRRRIRVGIGEVFRSKGHFIDIIFHDEDDEIVRSMERYPVEPHKAMIVTESGSIQMSAVLKGYDELNERSSRAAWIAASSGLSLRPREFYVANASKGLITVCVDKEDPESGGCPVKQGKAATFHGDEVKIFGGGGADDAAPIYAKPVKPRTSIVVNEDFGCNVTHQLTGEDIEAKKWTVDGRFYGPAELRN